MASIAITVNGVDRTTMIDEDTLAWRPGVNGAGEASFTLTDPTGAVIPDDGQVVTITVGGTLEWAGVITSVEVGFYMHNTGTAAAVTAEDYSAIPSYEEFNGTIPSQSVAATLAWLCNSGGALNPHSVTLSGSQVTGVTLPAIDCDFWPIDRILNEVALLSGLPNWRVGPTKVLRMWGAAEIASGVTFALANANFITFKWARKRFDYRNIQYVIYGPTDILPVTQTFSGNGVTRTFPFDYKVQSPPGSVVAAGVTKPVGVIGVSTAPEWNYDPSLSGSYGTLGGMRQDAAFTPLSGVQTLVANWQSNFPNVLVVTDGAEITARGRRVRDVKRPEITDLATAFSVGTAILREMKERPKVASITSRTIVQPGNTAIVSFAAQGMNETTFVIGASFRGWPSGTGIEAIGSYECIGGSERQDQLGDLWRRIINGSSSGSSSSGGGYSGGGVTGGGTGAATIGPSFWPFGGSMRQTTRSTAGNGVAFDALDGYEWSIFGEKVTGTLLLRVHLLTTGGVNGAVSARLYNETAGAPASDWTADVTAATFTYVSVVPTLATGENVYKLQLRVSGSAHATSNVAYWNATLESRT